MGSVFIAFESERNRQRIGGTLEAAGIHLDGTFRAGAELIRAVRRAGGGIIVCGYKLADMTADQLADDLDGMALQLVVALPQYLELCARSDLFRLPAPLSRSELIQAVERLLSLDVDRIRVRVEKKPRPEEEERLIRRAKALLIENNGMTEA